MNELADQLKIDPVKLRVINEPKIDEALELPFSSRHMLECFEVGREKFGWSKPHTGGRLDEARRPDARLGDGRCTWIAARFPAEATVQLRDDGTVRVACATQDIGTGTYTILAQIAAQKAGVPLDKVEVALGDTSFRQARSRAVRWRPDPWFRPCFAAADDAIASLLTIATTTPGPRFATASPRIWLWKAARSL